MKKLILVPLIIFGLTSYAADYYLSSSNGNDNNDGKSAASAWQTLGKLNSSFSKLNSGDKVLFKRGDTFYGTIISNKAFANGNPVIFSAYGSGVNPVITGFKTVSTWNNLGGNIWESSNAVSTLNDVNMVAINGVNKEMGRFPNTSWLKVDSHSGNKSITSSSLNASATNWTGADLVMKVNNYSLTRNKITSATGSVLNYKAMDYLNAADGYGFFIEDDERTLDVQNEWYYNPATKKLKIYSSSSPLNVQVSTLDTLVYILYNNNMTFDGIDFTGSNRRAFYIGSSSNITIQNCNFNFHGLSVIWGGNNYGANSLNFVFKNNSVKEVNSTVIMLATEFVSPYIGYSVFKNCGIHYGMFKNPDSRFDWGGAAFGVITVHNGVHGLIAEYNKIDSTGYTGISWAMSNNSRVNNNEVSNFCLRLMDGAGIYMYGGDNNYGNKIYSNIVYGGHGDGTGTPHEGDPAEVLAHGIYLDGGLEGNTKRVQVYDNTCFDNSYSGIFMNGNSNCKFQNNTCFNNGITQMLFWNNDNNTSYSTSHTDTVTNNIMAARTAKQMTAVFSTKLNKIDFFTTLDDNIYTRPINEDKTFIVALNGIGSWSNKTFAEWKSYSGYDSKSTKSPKSISDINDLRFEFNASLQPKTITLDANYIDVKGVTFNGTITLAPYSSAVLIKNGETTNQSPTANAGSAQQITLPVNSVKLSGSGTDPDGTITGYKWIKISGPSAFNILNATSAATDVTGLTEGTYQFELTVTDNKGATAKSSVQVTVSPASNIPPTANAGGAKSITLPINSVKLSGTGADTDGSIISYQWTKVSGPSDYNITNGALAATDITGLTEGIYKFELTVTDNSGATAKSRVQVNVNPALNIPPSANAGIAQQIILPLNTVKLSGVGTDTDGNIASYNWIKISGPSGYNIVNAATAITDVTGLTEGIYYFELTVIDDKGASDKSSVQVTVTPAINIPPTANAGNDQQITLPQNSVKLTGTGSDTDGSIVSYQWAKISGPLSYNFSDAASFETNVTGLNEGSYEFELTVTDNSGSSAISTVKVDVMAVINIPPTVQAGNSQVVTLPLNTVSLKGSATDIDGTIVTYEWARISGPSGFNIMDANAAETDVTNLTEGIYNFELTATDNDGATSKSSLQVFVNPAINIPPTANAGSNKSITLPLNTVLLIGMGTDADGTVVGYQWAKISGPENYSIVNANSTETDITDLTEGIYKFQLTVTDNNGSSAISNVQVTVNGVVNISPVANAGNNISITLPIDNILLAGTGTDLDGTIVSYHWVKISGPSNYNILNAASAETAVTGLTEGFYNFELTITDDKGSTAKSSVLVTVSPANNIPPTANAGSNKTITLPANNVSLTGTGTDSDGTIVGYQWEKLSGPASYSIVNASSSETEITGLAEGIYQFELTVSDNQGATAKSSVQVIVNAVINIPPTAHAGTNKTITLPANAISLTGSGIDTDGVIESYQWTKISGPSSYNILDDTSAVSGVSGLIEGIYDFELTVTDNRGATAKSSVKVIVNPALNVPPTANAGIDLMITLPVNNVSLTGSGTDSDGTIVTYKWSKVSGPSSFTIVNADSSNTDIKDLTEGLYEFELEVTDDRDSTAISSVLVTVSPAVNVPPVSNAGSNKTVTLPINTVTLTGSGTDSDGTIVSYQWRKISGPSSFTIINPDSSKVDIIDLVEGVYEFELTVTDDAGADSSSTVQVIVNSANNIPPTANAGSNKIITLPVNTVTLDGSGLDTDGTIINYKWTRISGPFWYTFANSSSAATTVSGMTQGVYKFRLTVTDNDGSKASATVQVTVNAAINLLPEADAGSDKQITLPINTVALSGIGTDTDGTIVSYRWKKISGPSSYNIVSASSAATNVTGLREGIYEFELTVTDNKGAVGKSSVQVTVSPALNIPPIANAGNSTSVTLPINSVSLNGSGADTDGTIVSFKWTKISGPNEFVITNSNSANTNITDLTEGIYRFELTVTDNGGAAATSIVQVTVNEAINIPPTANAGNNISTRLPVDSVSLTGSGTDADGTIVSYHWKKTSGPSSFTIINSDSVRTSIVDLIEGIYEFELTVSDNKGATATSAVQVIVTEAINIPPTANAGINKSITLPINIVSVQGSGSDVDGTVTSYSWRKMSGPGLITIINPGSANTDITNLEEGVYQFELTVTDNKGSSSISTVQITVNAAINIPPTSNAGNNKNITLPANTVALIGTGTDIDGVIVKYQWKKISGPSGYNIVNASNAIADITDLTEGIYKFELTVTDNKDAASKSSVQVTVSPAINIPPIANAGSNKIITLPVNTVLLTGMGTDADGIIASYKWSKISGPSGYVIENTTSAATDVTGLAEGIYHFELTVTDNIGATAKSSVQVTVNAAVNIAPTANAGINRSITLPLNTVSLTGTGIDTDGTIVSYKWIKISGPTSYNIVNATSSATDVTALTEGIYHFELTVTDNKGATAKSGVQVTVNPAINIPPTANAGSNKSIMLPISSVSLSGSGSDIDGSIANYRWTKISGPSGCTIVSGNSAVTDITGLTEGVYQFELTVTDNKGAIAKSGVQVIVSAAINIPPTANAGNNKSIMLPVNTVSLAGSGTDADGTISSYRWTKISGPSNFTIVNPSSAVTDVFALTEGNYKFELTVTDNRGATAKASVQVTVNPANNILPTSNAGSNKSITLPANRVSLAGSGADADGTIVSYKWTKISGPSSSNIVNASSAITDVTGLTEGIYQFELTVTDNKGATAKSNVQVTVNPANNILPTSNAGSNKSITLPANRVSLAGSGADADGTIASYKWIKISGPSGATIINASSAITDVTGLTEGIYLFELTVTDNKGATAKSSVQVTVSPANNILPTANAGSSKIITLPVNRVSLAGSGADADGTIASYKWTKISGPSAYNIVNAASAVTDVTGLTEGIYEFELTVTDNKGATAKSSVQVTVSAVVNTPPTANAGSNKSITLPVNTVSLTGSGTDTDGSIVSYKWTKISGPSSYSIVNASSAVTDVFGLTEGIYKFELTVTDNQGAIVKSTMQITVKAAVSLPNKLPVANAGADITITIPTNFVKLSGSGRDEDGVIKSFGWRQISGPQNSSIATPNEAITDVKDLVGGTYEFELTVTDSLGGIGKDTVVVVVTLGRLSATPELNSFKVYPNPVVDIATVDVNTKEQDTDVTMVIQDINGRTIIRKKFKSVQFNVKESINLSNMGKGVYLVTIYYDKTDRQSVQILKL